MNPAPLLTLTGRVHGPLEERDVPAYEGRDAYRDDAGVYHRRQDPREAYSIFEANVVTDGGGFITVTARSEGVEQATAAGWSLPAKGDHITLPVRPYLAWAGPDGRRFQSMRLALAADVLVEQLEAASKAPATGPTLARTGS